MTMKYRYASMICSVATGAALMWLKRASEADRGRVFRPSRWSPATRAVASGAAVAGAAVALSVSLARARRRRVEAELPPPF